MRSRCTNPALACIVLACVIRPLGAAPQLPELGFELLLAYKIASCTLLQPSWPLSTDLQVSWALPRSSLPYLL